MFFWSYYSWAQWWNPSVPEVRFFWKWHLIEGDVPPVEVSTYFLSSVQPESLLDVGGVLGIIISWIIAPLVAGISSFLLFGATKMTLLRPIGSKLRTLRAMPLYYGVTVMVVMSSILYKVIYFQAICSSEACNCRFLWECVNWIDYEGCTVHNPIVVYRLCQLENLIDCVYYE